MCWTHTRWTKVGLNKQHLADSFTYTHTHTHSGVMTGWTIQSRPGGSIQGLTVTHQPELSASRSIKACCPQPIRLLEEEKDFKERGIRYKPEEWMGKLHPTVTTSCSLHQPHWPGASQTTVASLEIHLFTRLTIQKDESRFILYRSHVLFSLALQYILVQQLLN